MYFIKKLIKIENISINKYLNLLIIKNNHLILPLLNKRKSSPNKLKKMTKKNKKLNKLKKLKKRKKLRLIGRIKVLIHLRKLYLTNIQKYQV